MRMLYLAVIVVALLALAGATSAQSHSAARTWNEELLFAIRRDQARPTIHARNLFHVSIAMWDAWAAYDPNAVNYLIDEKRSAADPDAARAEALSFAAYRARSEEKHGLELRPNDTLGGCGREAGRWRATVPLPPGAN